MRIIVADNIDFSKSDIDRLKKLGKVEIYTSHCKNEKDVINRLAQADIGILLVSPVTKEVINECKRLKMVSLCCTGYDHVNIKEAAENNITVSNVPGYAREAVAEQVYSMLLGYIRNICAAHENVVSGEFDWKRFQGFELKGKTLGIFGLGSIGTRVAELGRAFGMKVIVFSRSKKEKIENKLGLKNVQFKELLQQSDVISIHAALTNKTRNRFSRKEFKQMKDNSIIVNTARGSIINYADLAKSIQKGEIQGACLDVYPKEPPDLGHPIFKCDNILFSPHSAFNTEEAARKCYNICIDNVEAFLKGNPINVVNDNI